MSNKFAGLVARASSGVFIILVVVISRLLGLLEPLELFYFDLLLKTRYQEPQDSRIVLIEIDEVEAIEGKDSKISADALVELINKLQSHQPRVIGFNILSDLIDTSTQSFNELDNLLAQQKNIIVAESFLPPFIYPFPSVESERVGFVNIFPDRDNSVRRMLLGSEDFQDSDQFKFSFSLLLAKAYLEPDGNILKNGEIDKTAMQFGTTEIPRIYANTGGYNRIDDAGIQTIVNYRGAQAPFRTVSFSNISTELTAQLIRDKIVIIGVTDNSKRASSNTPVARHMDGLQMTAHFTSHITSAVIDKRPLVRSWKEIYEYLFIMSFGMPIVWIWNKRTSLSFLILTKGIILAILFSGSYILLAFYGCWITVIPPILMLCLNLFVYLSSVYRNEIRRKVIGRTFDILHNGPLQTLAIILNDLRSNHITYLALETRLKELSQDIREVGDTLQGESLSDERRLLLKGLNKNSLDLENELHELFHQIYSVTLKRDFHNFDDIKTRIRSFDFVPIKNNKFSLKRELCRYLEEAICNVGKHSVKPTQLTVIGKLHEGFYTLTVKDNGIICPGKHISPGQGTRSAIKLAKKLRGEFKRDCSPQKGTTCELKWRL